MCCSPRDLATIRNVLPPTTQSQQGTTLLSFFLSALRMQYLINIRPCLLVAPIKFRVRYVASYQGNVRTHNMLAQERTLVHLAKCTHRLFV